MNRASKFRANFDRTQATDVVWLTIAKNNVTQEVRENEPWTRPIT